MAQHRMSLRWAGINQGTTMNTKTTSEQHGSLEVSTYLMPIQPCQEVTFVAFTPTRELDLDAIKTIDDIKAILGAIRFCFSDEAAVSISHLLKKDSA